MKLLLALIVATAAIGSLATASDMPVPSKYFSGPVSHDVAAALKRGSSEHRPVWILAWDEAFYRSAQGKTGNIADYYLHYFYSNPQTKALVSSNFIQVFTAMDNKAISAWVDPSDQTHIPVFIIIGKDGELVMRKQHIGNPEGGLKAAQEAVAALNKTASAGQ